MHVILINIYYLVSIYIKAQIPYYWLLANSLW